MMEPVWQVVPSVGTPYALFAFIVAAGLTGYFIWMSRRYSALKDVTDPATRLQMSRDLLGLYVPAEDNLRIDDKVALLNKQLDQRHTRFKLLTGAGVFITVLILIATVLIVLRPNSAKPEESPKPPEQPKRTSLMLRLAEEPGEVSDAPGLLKGVAKPVEFTLLNPLSGLAIVEGMALEVLDVIEDNTGSTEAVFATYKYPIELNPEKRGRVAFGDKFKCAPGEADRIILGVQTKPSGHDYFVVTVHGSDRRSTCRCGSDSQILG